MNAKVRRLASGALVTAAIALLAPTSARAYFDCGYIYFPAQNKIWYLSDQGAETSYFSQPYAFWTAIAERSFNTGSDYDLQVANGLSIVNNGCVPSVVATSAYGGATTDLIVGDFNYNNDSYDYLDAYCYGGQCHGVGTYGMATWRTGELMFVDAPPTTITMTAGPPLSPDMLVHIWDVHLTQGVTYFFQFSSNLGSAQKMLLFRNKVAGYYWATRGDAEFEVSGCQTYTAPSTGYYGLAVVNDVYVLGQYTIGVTTAPVCVCARDTLVTDTPVHLASGSIADFTSFTQQYPYWTAVGLRPDAGSDWDLEVGDSGSPAGCLANVTGNSAYGAFTTDFVVSDFNTRQPSSLAVHASHYSGLGGATLEWHKGGGGPGSTIRVNDPTLIESWGAGDVLQCWDVELIQGHTYSFKFFTTSPNIKLFLFQDTGSPYVSGRGGAEFQTTTDLDYLAPTTGFYGVVVVKDDDQPGAFALRVGTCAAPYALTAGYDNVPFPSYEWESFTPAAGAWTAIGIQCFTADWDLQVCGATSGGAWPDCYGPLLAESDLGSVPDLIVGDFHHNAPGTYIARAKQFSSGALQVAHQVWTGPASFIGVNAPAVTASIGLTEVLRIYEAYLIGGVPYQIHYLQIGSTNRTLLVFGNTTGSDYWAPRNQALVSTQGDAPFTPGSTGYYAFVLSNDLSQPGDIALRITTNAAGVEGPVAYATRLLGATPNPAREDMAIRYSLASAAAVRLELLDTSGRRVWLDDEGTRAAGLWDASLPRSGADGGRLRPGLYFLRFSVDGRVSESRKVSLVD